MSRVLCIQFRTDQSEPHEQACIRRHVPEATSVEFLSVHKQTIGDPSELLSKYDCLVLGGLGEADATERDKPIIQKINKMMQPLIDYVISEDYPTLGVCYGHQLIAELSSGGVVNDPELAETGIHEMEINEAGRDDKLFAGINSPFQAVVGHQDTVLTLPTGAIELASNQYAPNQAYRLKSNIYGVQFHGELNHEDLKERLELYPQYVKNIRNFKYIPTPEAPLVLKNFVSYYS